MSDAHRTSSLLRRTYNPVYGTQPVHHLVELSSLPGKDYVILCSDMSAGRGIIKMKSDENKLKALGPHLAMAYSGEPGDTNNFADFVDRNMRLYHIR